MSSECLSVTLKQITTLVEPLYPLPANFGKDDSLNPGFPFKYLSVFFLYHVFIIKKATALVSPTFDLYPEAAGKESGTTRSFFLARYYV